MGKGFLSYIVDNLTSKRDALSSFFFKIILFLANVFMVKNGLYNVFMVKNGLYFFEKNFIFLAKILRNYSLPEEFFFR